MTKHKFFHWFTADWLQHHYGEWWYSINQPQIGTYRPGGPRYHWVRQSFDVCSWCGEERPTPDDKGYQHEYTDSKDFKPRLNPMG